MYICNAGPLSRPMSVPAPNTGLYSGGHHLPSTSRQHEQPNNLGMHGNGGASSSQGGANSGMVSPNSSSGNHQVSSTSPLVIPQPVKIRPPKTYHCRMCDQVNVLFALVFSFVVRYTIVNFLASLNKKESQQFKMIRNVYQGNNLNCTHIIVLIFAHMHIFTKLM